MTGLSGRYAHMLTLLIDNYDSFTYNLFQLLAEENGREPIVVRNDEASWEQLLGLGFDNVVLSPGPGRPERTRDFGVCAEAIRRCETPLLGVCLGHQGLGWVHGGRVVAAPEPMHGRVRAVEHAGAPLFAGIPERFEATRYHSLCLARPLPEALEEIAWSDDGVAMAVAHRDRPQWGVQFHPESIATEYGRRLLANFRDLTAGSKSAPVAFASHTETKATGPSDLRLRTRRLDRGIDPGRAFVAMYGESPDSFWLDSSSSANGGRFSFMGDASGPLAATVTYDVDAGEVTVERGGETEVLAESIFDYLERELERLRPLATDLPFDFDCGFAGYLGYELKADCASPNTHSSPHPDAAFILTDRLIAFDHEQNTTYLLCLSNPETEQASDAWLSTTEASLSTLEPGAAMDPVGEGSPEPPRCCSAEPSPTGSTPGSEPSVSLRLARSHHQYLEDIAECEHHLREGDSYELCLTNSIATELDADPLALYIELRRVNPAPFASYLRFGDLAVLSSSPERFLSIDRAGRAEAKPIKGTSPRGADADEDTRLAARLRDDEKNRAENLMIVDLLRNDLGSVCRVGSVEVPSLMAVESYETVHQLVSTVRGRLREGTGPVECARACFPPGSMTGAPKLRSIEILDRLEGRSRGVYSGAIGYFGLGGGCDLSVTIRTIVLDGDTATIGAGGAIVLQSEPEREFEEMLLKAAAPLRAIAPQADLASISLSDPCRAASSPPPASAHDLTS
ncbi:MAG TPA: aminodeoxychorismate synthase component I [Solirubrobacterales bacterium]|nr:aminodeoxychorismate synthase component I [Solirubrobacterales bacterium]